LTSVALPTELPKSRLFYLFNTSRPIFSNIKVRQALTLLFDFELANRDLFFGLYSRSAGFFDGSELSSINRPADDRERALLTPFLDSVLPDVLEGTWRPPVSDGTGRDRESLRHALNLFADAGYEIRNTRMVNKLTGAPFTFEMLITEDKNERLAQAYGAMLSRAGIAMQVRKVDPAQYAGRRGDFDFDMVENEWGQSLSPGNEQIFYWGSAGVRTSRNSMGVKNAAADAMITALLKAKDRADFVAAVRALDRILISGSYVIPLFHSSEEWIARWRTIERPGRNASFGYIPEAWWKR
jgi:peptide/nickel transport system substrate-binding protein